MAERVARPAILVIDDDEDVCLSLKEYLTREGYPVGTLNRPIDALADIKEGRYRIVLLGLRQPQLEGVGLLRELRALRSDLCLVVMARAPLAPAVSDALEAGSFAMLRKPFELAQVRQVVERAVCEGGVRVDAEKRVNQLLGGRIRALRKERLLTLKEVAGRTAVSVSLISQIELGKSAASVSTLRKLGDALGVSIAYLFDGI